MGSFKETRSVLIKFVPFILSIVTYFCGVIPRNDKVLLAFTRCLPILCLIIFVGLYVMDIKAEYYNSSFTWYVQLICLGLLCSGVGDALMVWPAAFPCSLIAFTIGQIHYALALGFQPRAWKLGLFQFIIAIAAALFLVTGASGIYLVIIPIYSLTLLSTIWRATAFFTDQKYWSCIRWTTVYGSIIFGLSHFIIGVEKFKMHIMYINELDMILYYVAQLLITLSITEPHFQSSTTGLLLF